MSEFLFFIISDFTRVLQDWIQPVSRLINFLSMRWRERHLAGSHSTTSHLFLLNLATGLGLKIMWSLSIASKSLSVPAMTGTRVESALTWFQQRAMVWSFKTCARKTHPRSRNGEHALPFHLPGCSPLPPLWGSITQVVIFNPSSSSSSSSGRSVSGLLPMHGPVQLDQIIFLHIRLAFRDCHDDWLYLIQFTQ